jgi:hypothetical protein
MGPEEDVRAFAALCGSLELVGDLFLGLHFDGNPHLLLEFLAEVPQGAIASVIANPDEEFAVCPGKCLNGGENYEETKEKFFAHILKMLDESFVAVGENGDVRYLSAQKEGLAEGLNTDPWKEDFMEFKLGSKSISNHNVIHAEVSGIQLRL